MAENSKIEWTTHTWNPWLGCTKVSPGCKYCYAETLMDTRYGNVEWGPTGTRVRTSPANWRKPILWDVRAALDINEEIRVFPSLCDVFEDWPGPIMSSGNNSVILSRDGRASNGSNRMTLDDVRSDLFNLIDATPHLTWLLLTKRPENIRAMWTPTPGIFPEESAVYRHNVWLGTSVENQETADARIPELLKCRGLSPVLWVSYEPALEPIRLVKYFLCDACEDSLTCCGPRGPGDPPPCNCPRIDWLIVGGESEILCATRNLEWYRSAIAQCQFAGVPVFMKQLGAVPLELGKTLPAVWDAKGGNWDEWPEDLRIRQYPKPQVVDGR